MPKKVEGLVLISNISNFLTWYQSLFHLGKGIVVIEACSILKESIVGIEAWFSIEKLKFCW